MGVSYVRAQDGKKFAMTEKGSEVFFVRGKYEEGSIHRARYEKSVPHNWIEMGYVKEVDKE